MPATRLLELRDAPVLADLLATGRQFFAPWDAVRDEAYFTPQGQLEVLETALDGHARGTTLPHAVLDESGQVVGRVTLNTIVRGPFQSCVIGYWVAQAANGRGLATAAVAEMKGIAFGRLGLHRIEAGTLVHNLASQRVLARNGFERFGLAPQYLNIAGRWQDHVLFQVLAP